MQQLYFIGKRRLEWRDVPQPVLADGYQAVVRPFAVAKCDLDDAYLFNDLSLKLKIGKLFGMIDHGYYTHFGKEFFKGPFPFGHECVAEVIETGNNVKDIKVGDVVSVPFQISCGRCLSCQSGITSACEGTPPLSMYGFGKYLQFGGAMSDKLLVPYADHMLLKLPEDVDPIHLASLSDNVPDAYRNIGYELEVNPQRTILVIGGKAKSVALYTVIIAKALNALQVDYVDFSKDRLELATRLGADTVFDSLEAISGCYDIVVEAGSTDITLRSAMKFVKPHGLVSSSGIYLKKVNLSLMEMYSKGVVFRTGLVNARTCAGKVLSLVKQNKLDLSLVTTRLDTWDNAVDAFLFKTSKVIVTRDRLMPKR